MNGDLVSIITPTYNCSRFIAETIECVRNQTYRNWEMLIVDDCSTDNTREIVSHYCLKDNRIQYHCLDAHSGAAVARNTALKMAQGRWVAFLDSDDLWMSTKLEEQIEFMETNNFIYTYTNYEEIAADGSKLGKMITGPRKISRLGMIAYCWPGCLTVMYDARQVGLIQIPPIQKNNDYAMWLRVIKKANCMLYPKLLASYRKRTQSISNAKYHALIKWHYKLFADVERKNKFTAALLTMHNLFWAIYKKLRYVKHF